MRLKFPAATAGALLIFLRVVAIHAAAPPAIPRANVTTRPADVYRNLAGAFTDMFSSRYGVRRKGLKEFQATLTRKTIAALEQSPLEQRNRLLQMLHFTGELAALARYLLPLPAARRKRFFGWIQRRGILPVVVEAFSPDADQRARAAQALARCPGRPADQLLAWLVADPDPRVLIATMNATWSRKDISLPATALWRRFINPGGQTMPNHMLVCLGRSVWVKPSGTNMIMQIAPSAVQELCHWKSPAIKKLLVEFIRQCAAQNGGYGPLTSVYNVTGRRLVKLFAAYRPRRAVPSLLTMVRQPANFAQRFNTPRANVPFFGGNGGMRMVYADNRTQALDMLMMAADKSPRQFGMVRARMSMWEPGNNTWISEWVWTCRSAAKEDAAIQTMEAYWKKPR